MRRYLMLILTICSDCSSRMALEELNYLIMDRWHAAGIEPVHVTRVKEVESSPIRSSSVLFIQDK
jgi:hypothetical protein